MREVRRGAGNVHRRGAPRKSSGDLMLALPMTKYGSVFIWL